MSAMNRILIVQTAVLELIAAQEGREIQRDESLDWERLHLASCAALGFLMAEEQGEDPALAAVACSLHDVGRILTGKQEGHAPAGRAPARVLLERLDLFTPAEIDLVAEAVACHSDKDQIGTPLEEIVKDADVVACRQYGLPLEGAARRERYDRWCRRHSPGGR